MDPTNRSRFLRTNASMFTLCIRVHTWTTTKKIRAWINFGCFTVGYARRVWMHAPLPREIGATSAPRKREKVWIETDGLFGGWHASVFVIEKQKKWKLKAFRDTRGGREFSLWSWHSLDRAKNAILVVIDNAPPWKG